MILQHMDTAVMIFVTFGNSIASCKYPINDTGLCIRNENDDGRYLVGGAERVLRDLKQREETRFLDRSHATGPCVLCGIVLPQPQVRK